jgi:putative mRNA 3-end processing factor
MTDFLEVTASGLYCAAGDFYVDPWQPVPRALITHAHADHARAGSEAYLAAAEGLPVLRARLSADATIETLRYGEQRRIGNVDVSFHPAGHVLGSAQIRIVGNGATTVVSGDYKLAPDPTCAAFEPVRCDVFVTESTFGLPIFRWDDSHVTMRAIAAWWQANRETGEASVLFAYALGKAQRVMAGLTDVGATLPGPVYCHGAIERINDAYRAAGVVLPPTLPVAATASGHAFVDALILAPPSAQGTPWMRRFEPCRTAFASGWMAIRGTRRRRNLDRGFVLSDHADWPGVNAAIAASGAGDIRVTHGYAAELVRCLTERGYAATRLATHFEGEAGADVNAGASDAAPPETPDT